MKVLQSSENLSSDIDCDQSRVQPLLLDGNCFFKKISQLDHPLIDKLNLNNMNKDFCEYWNYFASDDKKRQHVLRQLIEPKTNFVHNAKDKRAASFLKQTAIDENKVSALPAEKAESIIFDEFISCFRDGQSKANVTAKRRDVAPATATATAPAPYTGYQSEKHNIIKQMKMCRNPYEIEFYKQKLRRLKELEQRRCEASERLFRQKQSDEQAVNATSLGRAQNTINKNVIKYQKPQDHMQKKAKTKHNVIMQKYNPWNANDAVMQSALDKNANINMNNTKFSSSKSKDYAYTTNYQEQLQAYEAKLLNMQTKNQRKHINKDEKTIEGSAGKVKPQQNIPFLSTDNYAHIIKKKQIFDRADNLPYVFTKEKLFDNDCKENASTSNDISHFSRRQRKSKENKRKHQIRESRPKTTRDDANAIPSLSRSNASGTQQYRTDLQALQNYEQKLKKLKKLMKHKKREINAMIADKDEQREIKRNMKKEYKANLQLLKGFEQKITELKITNKENKQSKRKSIHVDGIEELNKHFKKLSKYSIESRSKAIASSEKFKRKSLRNRFNSKNNNEEKKPEEDLVKQSSETTIKFHESDTRNNFKPKSKHKTKKNRLEIEKIIQKWNEIESKTIAQKSQKLGKQNQTERHLQNRIRYEKFLAMLRNISEKLRNHKMHEVMKLIKNLKKLLEDEQKTAESLIDINDLQQLKYRVENVLYLKRSERNKSKLQKQSLDKIIQLKTKSYSKYSNSAKYFASVKKNQMPKERFSDYSTTSTIIFLGQQKKNSILQESKQGQSQSQSLQNESSLISLAAAFSNSYRVSNNRELTANTAEALLPQELQNFLIEQRERNSFDDNIELDATNSTETDNQSEECQEASEKHQIYTFMSMSKVVVYKNPYASQKSIDEIIPNDSQSKTSNVNETNTKGSMHDEHWPMAKVQVPFVAPIPKITLQNLIQKFEEHKQAKSLEQCATADVKKPLSLKHVLNRSYSLDELPKQIHPKMPKRTSLSTQNLSNDIAPSQRSNRSKQNLIMPQLQLENAIGNESEIGNPIKPAQLTQPYMYEMLRRLKTLELRICYAQMMMHSSSTAPEQHEPASLSICEN